MGKILNAQFSKGRDMDIIELAYGGGGKLTDSLIRNVILKYLPYQTDLLDAAFINTDTDKIAFTTDSYVVSPIFFPSGDIGKLSVCGTCNDLAMVGAKPIALSLAIIIEEGFRFDDLENILKSIANEVQNADVKIVTGDTKVVPKGLADGIYINTSGIGKILPQANIGFHRVEPNDVVIVSGTIGDHSLAVMSKREGLQFDTPIKSDVANLAPIANALITEFTSDIKFLRDPTRGGLAGVLVDIAEGANVEIEVDEQSIPITPSVRSATEILGLDILSSANEGKFVAIVSNNQADKVMDFLHSFDLTSKSAIIGKVVSKGNNQVILKTRIGGKRIIQKPYGEQLPRIC